MAGMAFRRRIRAIKDGEPVNAAVAGRPDADLQSNLNYVLDLLDAIQAGQGVTRSRVALAPEVLPGQAVYWDGTQGRFAPALAAVDQDDADGLVLAASCDVQGVVLVKENQTLGDVLLAGYGQIDLTQALQDGGTVLPGRYYLSTRIPGALVQQKSPLSVAVLVADGEGGVYVLPALRDFMEDHVHYEFRLHATPAGGNGGTTVTAADPTLPGWLPADHASFAGHAPAGAAFGYNLAADDPLRRIWPPVPLASAQVFWDKGQGGLGATLVPKGANGLVVLDRYGIWWMSNTPADVPWPAAAPPEQFAPDNAAAGPENPRLEEMRITVTFTRMLFATDKTVVTSIRPRSGQPLYFLDCDDNPATAGDLYAGIDLDFIEGADLVDGGLVFKELDGATFSKGWVTEGLRQGSGCQLSSTQPQVRGAGTDAYTVHRGVVTIDVLSDQGETELPAQVERLGDAQQRYYEDVPYIGFGPDRRSGLRYVFDVPPAGVPSLPQFKFRAGLLGRAGGSLPDLSLTYRRLPRPAAGQVVSLPGESAELPLAFPTAGVAVTVDSYVEVESAPIAVAAGDTVLVWLVRSRGDGYTGEIGVLRSGGIVTGTAPS